MRTFYIAEGDMEVLGLLLWLSISAWLLNSVVGRYELLPWLYAKALRPVRFFQARTNESAAKRYIEACHGDLPTAEEFGREGHSVGFGLAMLPYFLEAEERQRERQRERERQARRLPTREQMHIPASAVFLDPETEDDCPECANGVDGRDHECRDGWKDYLRAVRAEWDAARSKQ